MAVFTLSVSAVKTAYDIYINAGIVVDAAKAAVVAAGARPTYPIDVVTNADWNSVTTAQNTWDAANVTLVAAVATATATQRTGELGVITALGYGSGDTSGICLDQWVKVVGAGGGALTYTNYIGAATNSAYLVISNVLPTQAFPNL